MQVANGLEDDPPGAPIRTLAEVARLTDDVAGEEPAHMTAALSDARQLFAVRHSSDGRSPSLYYGDGAAPTPVAGNATADNEASKAILVLSEPVDEAEGHWTAVPDSHRLTAAPGAFSLVPLDGLGRAA